MTTTVIACPVGKLSGEKHYFTPGTGQRVHWDVMGDPRTNVEVCPDCAESTRFMRADAPHIVAYDTLIDLIERTIVELSAINALPAEDYGIVYANLVDTAMHMRLRQTGVIKDEDCELQS